MAAKQNSIKEQDLNSFSIFGFWDIRNFQIWNPNLWFWQMPVIYCVVLQVWMEANDLEHKLNTETFLNVEHFVCGLGAGTFAKICCHPLDVVKKRFQVCLACHHITISSSSWSLVLLKISWRIVFRSVWIVITVQLQNSPSRSQRLSTGAGTASTCAAVAILSRDACGWSVTGGGPSSRSEIRRQDRAQGI